MNLKSILKLLVSLPGCCISDVKIPYTMVIDVEEEKSENIFDKLYQLIGKPRNYGPTPEEKEAMERKLLEERVNPVGQYAIVMNELFFWCNDCNRL